MQPAPYSQPLYLVSRSFVAPEPSTPQDRDRAKAEDRCVFPSAINDGDLPLAFGGPLRLRVPRQTWLQEREIPNASNETDSAGGFVSAVNPKSPILATAVCGHLSCSR